MIRDGAAAHNFLSFSFATHSIVESHPKSRIWPDLRPIKQASVSAMLLQDAA